MITTKKGLDETDKKILHAIREGKTYEEMSTTTVFLAVDSIKRRVKIMKEKYECKSRCELIYKLKDVMTVIL